MRITNNMITTRYIRSLGTLSSDLNKLNTQIASGRKFSKVSENTSAAIKAFQVRRDLSKADGFKMNLDHAKDSLTNAETSLMHIEDLMQSASVSILSGQNGVQSQNERNIIATELRNIQDQLLQTLNSSASDSYYFGGSNTDVKPFSVVSGKLTYNGASLDSLVAGSDELNLLKNDSLYVDIGLNVQFESTGAIDKSTIFEYSVAGINIVGSGVTSMNIDGAPKDISNNLFDLLGEIINNFESPSYSFATSDTLYGHFQSMKPKVVENITSIGSRIDYLDFISNRLETQTLTMQERQLSIEGADPVKTIIQFKSQEVAYSAALQMGTKIIQPSIFDFMS